MKEDPEETEKDGDGKEDPWYLAEPGARVVFSDGEAMLGFTEELKRGFETRIDRGAVSVKLMRCENTFTKVGPTHFRSLLHLLRLTSDDRSCYAEVQVHHNMILALNEESHARVHYHYFHSLQ